ncbi:hypothetical protein GYMLUDRAFT_88771 [Collybiopsis luxurians FD-317 M1]|uniref:Protein kinase domain-containing protein n=1 Tax=Collybiopsis luxurians FD-317 M1 TaxID=944289 RepID=A0A0D0C303_9AGAR|nr:hypothetical protein GYMLUDRAFT_88771 [Collybiopsis luxurians FD-317 M1]
MKPGWHAITLDSLGVYLAKSNSTTGDHDFQQHGPGFQPILRPPPHDKFSFDPQRLKTILSWETQSGIVRDLEFAALSPNPPSAATLQITPVFAAFYLFKCYCYEFGTIFDPEKACYWLRFTASCENDCEECYLARAWCWRVHNAFNVPLDIPAPKLYDWMYYAIIHGHRKCITESVELMDRVPYEAFTRAQSERAFTFARYTLSTERGGVGQAFFEGYKLRRRYDMSSENFQENLAREIQEEMTLRGVNSVDDIYVNHRGVGQAFFEGYKLRRRYDMSSENFQENLAREIQEEMTLRGVNSVDDIYVNHRGDGLLHMAAALGKLKVLNFLVETYHPNIQLGNATREESPLLSACRGGHLDCALYLLDLGASPSGDPFAKEMPLWWLSAFKEEDMPVIASRLIQSGASLSCPSSPSFASVRHPIRNKYAWADYENFLLLPASPLSRAVMMESLPAVRTLLSLGADPLEGLGPMGQAVNPSQGVSVCPVAVAAVLCLPEILELLLEHVDKTIEPKRRLFSEIGMLEMALDCAVTIGDPLSLDCRVARHGPKYKTALTSTLRILHEREKLFVDEIDDSAAMLSRLTILNRADIVETLLSLGHSAKGFSSDTDIVFPIVTAVEQNNEAIFQLLVQYGADIIALYEVPQRPRKCSLLQILAERPRQSRPGAGIARILIDQGVRIDPPASNSVDATQQFSGTIKSRSLAAFVLLISGLEQTLHGDGPLFLDPLVSFTQRRALGSGASFQVERVEWKSNSPYIPGKFGNRWGTSVAVKQSVHQSDPNRIASNWTQLLSEVRALLHEPIRFHPNIVRLLGLSWGAVDGMRSNFPALVLELSELGTFAHLQMNSESLPFETKKKLCWDVSKGISVLHACSVIHGDLKHENVLIYPNPSSTAPVRYVAKISDFGGSVMDLGTDDFRSASLRTPTGPWVAPEFYTKPAMTEIELKLTDVYALGLLVWRTFLDGENPYRRLHELTGGEPYTESQIYDLKCSRTLLDLAKESVKTLEPTIGGDGAELLRRVFDKSIQHVPSMRDLTYSIAALQASCASEIEDILDRAREENDKYNKDFANMKPGWHVITQDGLNVFLAKSNENNGDYDFQNKGILNMILIYCYNEFFFDPQRLKAILSWEIQCSIFHDLELAALSPKLPGGPSVRITPVLAGFYLFKCYCYEFGTTFDPEKACYWLRFTASCEDDCEECYLARAWCWRVHDAFDIPLDIPAKQLYDWMYYAIIHGHRKCIEESKALMDRVPYEALSRAQQEKAFSSAQWALSTMRGGVGQAWFTASCEDDCEECYLARAWCWRVHDAFDIPLDIPAKQLYDWMYYAIIHGHRKCIEESKALMDRVPYEALSRAQQEKAFSSAQWALSTMRGGVGQAWFEDIALRRKYDMLAVDFQAKLVQDIQDELDFRGIASINDISVNHRSDGLLHMAAGLGKLNVLKFLIEKYQPDINKANDEREETPLLSACRGGHLDCALYLLDLGAVPDGHQFSKEMPLWWLCSFKEEEMPIIASRLIQAGALLTCPPRTMMALTRESIERKYAWADYENFFLLPASPLSRAVMMESLPAVRTLLSLGADPLEGLAPGGKAKDPMHGLWTSSRCY